MTLRETRTMPAFMGNLIKFYYYDLSLAVKHRSLPATFVGRGL